MKSTLKLTALALVIAASGFVSAVQAQVVIKTGVAIIPSPDSPNYSLCLAKLQAFLKTGVMPVGNATNDPTVPLFPDRIRPEYMMRSSTTPLWFGTVNPTNPALVNERGNIPVYWVITESPQGIRLADLRISLSSSDPYEGHPQGSLTATHRFNDINYSLDRAVGVIWGPGGKGSPGEVLVTSGSPNQVVNVICFTGLGTYYTCNTQADIDNIRAYVMGQPTPFTITVRYDLLGADGNPVATAMKQWSVVPYRSVRPRLVAMMASGGEVELTVFGDSKESYTVKTGPTVNGPWTELITVFNPTGGVSIFNVPLVGQAKFFR